MIKDCEAIQRGKKENINTQSCFVLHFIYKNKNPKRNTKIVNDSDIIVSLK